MTPDLLLSRLAELGPFVTTETGHRKLDEICEAVKNPWQDIASAPKDGTRVVIARRDSAFGWVRGVGYYASLRGIEGWVPIAAFSEVPGVLGLAHPTHWLPAPPSPPDRKP